VTVVVADVTCHDPIQHAALAVDVDTDATVAVDVDVATAIALVPATSPAAATTAAIPHLRTLPTLASLVYVERIPSCTQRRNG
jgi:hypothetical protein